MQVWAAVFIAEDLFSYRSDVCDTSRLCAIYLDYLRYTSTAIYLDSLQYTSTVCGTPRLRYISTLQYTSTVCDISRLSAIYRVSQEECVNRSYHLPFRLQRNTRKRTSITQCLVNSRKYTSRRNPSIGKTPLVYLNSSTCIAIAKSIHKMHVTIFHVGKHKRHFSNTVQLACHPFPKQP